MKSNDIVPLLLSFCKEAGAIALKKQKKVKSKLKADKSVVSEVDLEITDLFYKKVFKKYSKLKNHVLIDEETSKENLNRADVEKCEYLWTLDPIDGTTPFVTNLPFWGILISIYKKGKPWIGFCYIPAMKQLVYTDSKETWVMNEVFTAKSERQKVSNNAKEKVLDPVLQRSSWVTDVKVTQGRFAIIDTYSAACNTSFFLTSKVIGLITTAMIWDLSALWAMTRHLDVVFYDFKTKKIYTDLKSVKFSDKYRFPNTFLVCHKRWLKTILEDAKVIS
jgi:fructose-1,6-bisphosphatase/inositol monophosphatase family enzyme